MKRSDFKGTYKGKSVDLYTLTNKHGLQAAFTNYGARLVALLVPDREGELDNIVVGHSSMDEFLSHSESYFGAVVGRYANRIANSSFDLHGHKYQLPANEGRHHIHGGPEGFHQVVWGSNQIDDQTLHLSYRSLDGESGYPGNLGVSVRYELSDDNELHIHFQAEADAPTILNMSHHAYYNLHGSRSGASIYDHYLMINSGAFTPVGSDLIPTGELKEVEGTPMDFRKPKPIGRDRGQTDKQLTYGNGYDHNFVLNKNSDAAMTHAARVEDPESGRVMDLHTTQPGLQFYECQRPVKDVHSAFCLEPQHFPDSPNKQQFPSVVLDAYSTYRSTTKLTFDILPH